MGFGVPILKHYRVCFKIMKTQSHFSAIFKGQLLESNAKGVISSRKIFCSFLFPKEKGGTNATGSVSSPETVSHFVERHFDY